MHKKVKEDAFLYLDPKPPKDKFAQCGTCMMFTGSSCTIHGPGLVKAEWSCGLYVHGKPMPDMKGEEHKAVTPKESGLVKEKVRCENCHSFNSETGACLMFQALNEVDELFDMRTTVHPQGCCNGFISRDHKVKSMKDLKKRRDDYNG